MGEKKVDKRWLREFDHNQRTTKRPCLDLVNIGDGIVGSIYKFRVLLPNGTTLGLKIRDPEPEIPVEEFVERVRGEYFRQQEASQIPKERFNWKNKDIYFVDAFDKKLAKRINFNYFEPNKYHILRLHDGSGEAETYGYENMWDLTPDIDMLMELPAEYTYETALADLIDNSLQAVWSNGVNEKRLVSVELRKDRITIFDTGPGMDGSVENSIVKWGKIGASLHRSSKEQGIGGKPPYLTPFFGMFGYGGPIASMHLGRHALVSSKTKNSKKVYNLRLEREALLSRSRSEKTWRTDGGIRHPTEEEICMSPHGSFTKVEIFEPKMKGLDMLQLKCKLKDIYFPYIQCDELSNTGKTSMPIEFQVNGTDLAEILSGEVATTNLHSCNDPGFVFELHFSRVVVATSSLGVRSSQEANARLKFVYFPVVEGKESIEEILQKLEAEGCGITENFETFSRVSIRRLGRLLPDSRWNWLPFMEPRQKKGDKAQLLKRCCLRVKCFIDTDAGFNPTRSKTDLAHHHPYTVALKNFGANPLEREREVKLEIYKDGKQGTLLQLEKQYQEWVFRMHDHYDEEIECGGDQPLHIVSPNKKGLGISSDVVRVHKVIQRKGTSWKSGQKIKVLKGAYAGCHKKNVYATLEYFLLEGFQRDAGGEARLICRPLGVPIENGCSLETKEGNTRINIRGSLSLPINLIDSGKCLAIDSAEWEHQEEKHRQKMPSSIEILSARNCRELEVEGALSTDSTVYAGHVPPKEIVAVVRPASFNSATASQNLDPRFIVRDLSEMCLQIKCRSDDKNIKDFAHVYSGYTPPASRNGFHGLYIFPLGCTLPHIFEKAGVYSFTVSLKGESLMSCETRVTVRALSEVGRWRHLVDDQGPPYNVRVGFRFPPFSIACYDKYENRTPFASVPKVRIKIISARGVIADVHSKKTDLSSDKLTLVIKDTLVLSNQLDKIRPSFRATLLVSPQDELFSVSIPCQVLPGFLQKITTQPRDLDMQLLPGHEIKQLVLEMSDAYGNRVEEGLEILLNVDGFSFQDHKGSVRKVDELGCIDLSGLLKVTRGYGSTVSLSVLGDKIFFKKEFETEKRELRAASAVPESCTGGSELENIVFEIINSEGHVDETIHDDESCGQSHSLTIKSESSDIDDSVKYTFRHGRCLVRAISLPPKEGKINLVAAHARHPELNLTIEVHLLQATKVEPESLQYSDGDTLLLKDSPALNAPIVEPEGVKYRDGKLLLKRDSSPLKSPKMEHDDQHDQLSVGQTMLLQDSPAPNDLEGLVDSIMKEGKKLEGDWIEYGLLVGHQEKALEMLHVRQVELKKGISSLELDLLNGSGNSPGKEEIMELIESKGDTASVVCKLLRRVPFQKQQNNSIQNILGVVALIGTVETDELSRILAEYLGEDQMLAVFCKSYAGADALEDALYEEATRLGTSVTGRYLVICLDDTRPYPEELGFDLQRRLPLPSPTLPSGNTPSGFLGYAVNMINLDVHYLRIRTDACDGLRGTLLYCLFGELQVYDTRENMKEAKACISHGAVSLDGGIMRGKGILSLGHRDPEIRFPVIAPESQICLAPQIVEILKQIKEKKLALKETIGEIEKEAKVHEKVKKKFHRKSSKYKLFTEEKASLLKGLACRTYMDNSNDSCCLSNGIITGPEMVVLNKPEN